MLLLIPTLVYVSASPSVVKRVPLQRNLVQRSTMFADKIQFKHLKASDKIANTWQNNMCNNALALQ